MDRRRSRRSGSRSPRRRRRSRSYSRSPSYTKSRSRSRSVLEHSTQSSGARDRRYQQQYQYKKHNEHRVYLEEKRERVFHGSSRRSRSRSIDRSRGDEVRYRNSSRRRSPSPRYQTFNARQRSPSPRRSSPSPPTYKKHYSRQRSPSPRRPSSSPPRYKKKSSFGSYQRSRSPRHRSPSPRRRSPSPRRRSPSSRRRSPSPHRSTSARRRSVSSWHRSPSDTNRRNLSPKYWHRRSPQRSPSPRRYSPSPRERSLSPRRRSVSPQRRSTSVHHHGRSPRREWRSRSRSDSRRRRSEDESRSGSSRDRSNSHGRRSVDPPPRKPPISSVDTLPKSKIDDNQEVKEAALEGRNLEERHTPATGNNHWGSSAHGNSYGYNHQHFHSRRPLQHDARALSSSPAPQGSSTPAKSVVASDHVTISSPRGGISSTSTPPKSSSNGNHHTSPVVNPVLEKKREAQRESHRAYLKSKSDYNCAEQKYISIEAELRLVEFWLDVMTKNLEDVGKRIEVHDWNFQKIVNEEESDDA